MLKSGILTNLAAATMASGLEIEAILMTCDGFAKTLFSTSA